LQSFAALLTPPAFPRICIGAVDSLKLILNIKNEEDEAAKNAYRILVWNTSWLTFTLTYEKITLRWMVRRKVVRTGGVRESGSSPVTSFGISGVEHSGSATTVLLVFNMIAGRSIISKLWN
jgi:hypothetical protein